MKQNKNVLKRNMRDDMRAEGISALNISFKAYKK